MLPRAATEFYAVQQDVATTVRNEVGRLWRTRMGDDFDSSWRRLAPSVLAVIVEGQAQLALRAQNYNHTVLDSLDVPDQPAGELVPSSLVGVASDGRRLDTLAAQSVVTSKVAISQGASTRQALDEGGQWLQLMAQLQVADTARVAVGIGTASRRNIIGNVRILNPPVCQRCAVLGGRFYRWSKGFDRHPGDDCTMMPVRSEAEARAFVNDPMDAYRNGEIKDLTQAQIKAIEEGADLARVVNAYRGMSTTATERVLKSSKPAVAPVGVQPGMPDLLGFLPPEIRDRRPNLTRLTPEGIYLRAGDDRNEAIRLLRAEGYIV